MENSDLKYCKDCEEWKTKDNFWKNKRKPDGLNPYCKVCSYERHQVWIRNNRETTRRLAREALLRRTPEQKEKARIAHREYENKNRPKVRERNRTNNKKHGNRQRRRLRKRMSKFLRGTNVRCPEFDFTTKELMIHLESLFTSEMTWENYNSFWIMDHIKPICAFNISKPEELAAINYLSNIRPVTFAENELKAIEDIKIIYIYTEEEMEKIEMSENRREYFRKLRKNQDQSLS